MAAKDTQLGELHEALAKNYIKMLSNPEECTPALLSSAAKFLKDNGITCEVGDEQMDQLKQKAGEVINFPFDVVSEGT